MIKKGYYVGGGEWGKTKNIKIDKNSPKERYSILITIAVLTFKNLMVISLKPFSLPTQTLYLASAGALIKLGSTNHYLN